MINEWLEALSTIIVESSWIAPLLALVAGKGSLAWGILLLLLYSIGHGILAVICGTSVGFVQKLSHNEQYGKLSNVLKLIMGLAMTQIGFYMFYLAF